MCVHGLRVVGLVPCVHVTLSKKAAGYHADGDKHAWERNIEMYVYM